MAQISVRREGEGISLQLALPLARLNERKLYVPAVMAGAGVLKRAAQQAAPRETGFLRASLIAWNNWRNTSAPLTGYVSWARKRRGGRVRPGKRLVATPFYARYLEEGTRKMRAHPFLQPALQQGEQAAVAAIEQKAAEIVAGVFRK